MEWNGPQKLRRIGAVLHILLTRGRSEAHSYGICSQMHKEQLILLHKVRLILWRVRVLGRKAARTRNCICSP